MIFPEIGGAADIPPSYTPPKPTAAKPVVAPPKPKITTNSKGNYVKPAATPSVSIPDIGVYLNQDTGYQQQLRDFAQALNDFNADITRRRGSLDTDFAGSQKALNDQKVIDLDSLKQDYGARGLLQSGLYGKAVGDYNTEFGQRMSDLDRQNQDAIASLTQQQGQFNSSQQLKQQAAREDAIRRRATQYGV